MHPVVCEVHARDCQVARFVRVLGPQQHRLVPEDVTDLAKQMYKPAAGLRADNWASSMQIIAETFATHYLGRVMGEVLGEVLGDTLGDM